MTKNILLVNPVPSDYPPLALMKISTYYKKLGYNVKYIEKINMFEDFRPDLILITSLFTWNFDDVVRTCLYLRKQHPESKMYLGGISASLLQKDYEKEFKGKDINLHFGIHNSYDEQDLDYTLTKKDYSVGYTTRGCPRKCGWCMVWRMEPNYIEYKKEYWSKFIKHKRILFYDNNILKASISHFKEVIDYMKENDLSYDFNQAMDARLLSIKHMEIFKGSKLKPIRFSFDSMDYDGAIQRAMKFSHDYGFNDGSVYVLYNFNDTPKEYYYRMKEIIKMNTFDIYPMRFQPLTAKKKDVFEGKHWKGNRLKNFRLTLNRFFNNSVIGRGVVLEKFERIFGKTPEEFEKLMDLKDINERNEKLAIKTKEKIEEKNELFEFNEEEIQEIILDSEGLLTRKDAINILKNKR